MEVNLNSNQNRIIDYTKSVADRGASAAASNAGSTASASNTDKTMSFERTNALEETLRQTSSVRPDKVAQAKALVADPNYPSNEALSRMSDLLAQHINNG